MSKPNLCDLSKNLQAGFEADRGDLAIIERRPADVEMARVLKTAPLRMASDPSSGAIAHWKHGALHDVVEPMVDHVIMTYPSGVQRLERRNGKSVAIGTARSGVVTIIPAGSSARWDIPGPVNVVQLYLPHTTLERVAGEADHARTGRSAGANRASRPHYIPIAHECGRCARGQRGPGCPVQAPADGSPGDAPAGCACRRASHVPADHGRAVANGAAPRHRTSALGRAIRTSRSPRSLRMPACRASTSAAPSRKAPGFRRMPGCASTGSSRP